MYIYICIYIGFRLESSIPVLLPHYCNHLKCYYIYTTSISKVGYHIIDAHWGVLKKALKGKKTTKKVDVHKECHQQELCCTQLKCILCLLITGPASYTSRL